MGLGGCFGREAAAEKGDELAPLHATFRPDLVEFLSELRETRFLFIIAKIAKPTGSKLVKGPAESEKFVRWKSKKNSRRVESIASDRLPFDVA